MTGADRVEASAARFAKALEECAIVAILRGIRPDEAIAVVEALFETGIRIAEVPLNSPDAFETVARLQARFGACMVIGAGTVTSTAEVARLASTGGTLCVSPNMNRAVIAAARAAGLVPVPGISTATEAFAAVEAGARWLKLFPALGREAEIRALVTVLPPSARIIAVGGVSAADAPALLGAGVAALGLGTDLYRPGQTSEQVAVRARAAVAAVRSRALVPRLLANPDAAIGESPLWLEDSGALIWTDPLAPRLLRWNAASGNIVSVAVDRPLWSLARRPGGDLVGSCDTGFCSVDPVSGQTISGAEGAIGSGCRLNDMVADSRGGLWGGSMHRGLLAGRGGIFHASAPLARPRQVASGLGVANGMAFTADETQLLVVDTLSRTLLRYPVDMDGGSLAEPVVLTDFMGLAGKPDGLCVAPDGHIWVAMWGGSAVVELEPDGRLVRNVAVPAPNISSLVTAPGGRLYVTTSRMRLGPAAIAGAPGSGGLFLLEGLSWG